MAAQQQQQKVSHKTSPGSTTANIPITPLVPPAPPVSPVTQTNPSGGDDCAIAKETPKERYPIPDVPPKVTLGVFDKGSIESQDKKWKLIFRESGAFGYRLDIYYEGARITENILGVYNASFDCNSMKKQDGTIEQVASLRIGISNMLGGAPPKAIAESLASLGNVFANSDVISHTIVNWLKANESRLKPLKPIRNFDSGKDEAQHYMFKASCTRRGEWKADEDSGEMMSPIHQVAIKIYTESDAQKGENGAPKDVRKDKISTPVSIAKTSITGKTRLQFDQITRGNRYYVMASGYYSSFIQAKGDVSLQICANEISLIPMRRHKLTKEEEDARMTSAAARLLEMGFDNGSLEGNIEEKEAGEGEGEGQDGEPPRPSSSPTTTTTTTTTTSPQPDAGDNEYYENDDQLEEELSNNTRNLSISSRPRGRGGYNYYRGGGRGGAPFNPEQVQRRGPESRRIQRGGRPPPTQL